MKKLCILFLLLSILVHGQDLTVKSDSSITIEKTTYITVSGNFSNSGTVTLNSGSDKFSSIIVSGTATGNIIYNRYVNQVGAGEWDLIGSPVSGLTINSFITETSNASTIARNGSLYAVGSYDNFSDTWTNATTTTTGSLNLRQGFQMATTSVDTPAFTGTVTTKNQTNAIQNNDAANSNVGKRRNLVANPFPSYINGNIAAHATNNFITINTLKLDDSFEAVYGYDADGTGYTIYNQISNIPLYITQGQAFFIAAKTTNTSSAFDLEMYNNTSLIGTIPISSRYVEEEQGINFSINAMGIVHMNSTTIPLT
jgi:hypothetical protein